ncbi:hypothetical protein ABK040_008348 [Willaertia magna]
MANSLTILPIDILYEISKFIDNIRDYYYLALTNKYFYNNMFLQNENNLFLNILNEIFKNIRISLKNNLPNFIFKLETISTFKNNLELLNNFINLKNLYIIFLSKNCTLNLNKLEYLNVNYGIFHKNTLNLKKLKVLKISHIQNAESCLNELNSLQKLKISSTPQFKGDCLKNFKDLKELNLTNLPNLEEDNFNELKQLTTLKLYHCPNITGNFLQNLKDLQNLKIIDCNKFENTLQNIGPLINLKKLTIKTYNTNSNFIKNLINLEYLKIQAKDLQDTDFYNLNNLQYLSIEGIGSVGDCFKYLNNLQTLKCDLELIKNLNDIKHIKKLYILSMPKNIIDKDLLQFTNIIQLYCHSDILGDCFSYLNKLQKLIIINNTNITDNHLEHLVNIEMLKIDNCPNIVNGKFLLTMKNLKKFKVGFKSIKIEKAKEQIVKGFTLKNIC